jgi:hypothetical protein
VGAEDGLLLGWRVGLKVGAAEGLLVGNLVGLNVGEAEGLLLGWRVGLKVGADEGLLVGNLVGLDVGAEEGLLDGVDEWGDTLGTPVVGAGVEVLPFWQKIMLTYGRGVSEAPVTLGAVKDQSS